MASSSETSIWYDGLNFIKMTLLVQVPLLVHLLVQVSDLNQLRDLNQRPIMPRGVPRSMKIIDSEKSPFRKGRLRGIFLSKSQIPPNHLETVSQFILLSFRPQGEIFKTNDINILRFLTFVRNDIFPYCNTVSFSKVGNVWTLFS